MTNVEYQKTKKTLETALEFLDLLHTLEEAGGTQTSQKEFIEAIEYE